MFCEHGARRAQVVGEAAVDALVVVAGEVVGVERRVVRVHAREVGLGVRVYLLRGHGHEAGLVQYEAEAGVGLRALVLHQGHELGLRLGAQRGRGVGGGAARLSPRGSPSCRRVCLTRPSAAARPMSSTVERDTASTRRATFLRIVRFVRVFMPWPHSSNAVGQPAPAGRQMQRAAPLARGAGEQHVLLARGRAA